jgi:hypothetical protein
MAARPRRTRIRTGACVGKRRGRRTPEPQDDPHGDVPGGSVRAGGRRVCPLAGNHIVGGAYTLGCISLRPHLGTVAGNDWASPQSPCLTMQCRLRRSLASRRVRRRFQPRRDQWAWQDRAKRTLACSPCDPGARSTGVLQLDGGRRPAPWRGCTGKVVMLEAIGMTIRRL